MSDAIPPMVFTWDGDQMKPRYPKVADKHYVVDETYVLVPLAQRSLRSHNFYFASVSECWKTLPEDLAERFPTADHLRKYALIKCGYFDSTTLVCSSKAEALRIAAFIRPTDEFGIVTVEGCTVSRYTAKSQSMKAMGKAAFRESTDKVLDFLANMIGTSKSELQSAHAA